MKYKRKRKHSVFTAGFILRRAGRIAGQARRLPHTARSARAWLALAALDAENRDDTEAARLLAELEATIL